jgi:hypothetical protein
MPSRLPNSLACADWVMAVPGSVSLGVARLPIELMSAPMSYPPMKSWSPSPVLLEI